MNKIKMSILSILRNPMKSIFLLLVSFILGTFIVSSFFVVQTTELIENTVKSQLSPIVIVDNLGKGLNDYEFTGDAYISNYSNEDRLELYKYLESYRNDDRVKAGENYYRLLKAEYKSNYDNDEYSSWRFIGINNTSDIVDSEINDTDELMGRYFFDNEIEEGKNVIILFLDPRGEMSPIAQLGDVVTYTFTYGIESFDMEFEVIGIYNMKTKTQMIGTVEETYLEPINFTYHDKDKVGLICNYAYIPYNTLAKIGSRLQEMEVNRQKDPSTNEMWYTRNDLIGQIQYIDSYFKLNSVDDLEGFVSDLKETLKDYPDMEITSSMDSYLDVKEAVNHLESLSFIVIVISLLSSLIVLSLVIYIYVKNRKSEIGLYLALGEKKKNVFVQLMLEILIVCLLGFGLSFMSGKLSSEVVTEHLIQSEEVFMEYNSEVMEEIENGNTLNQYMFFVLLTEMVIILVSSAYPMMKIMNSNPKDSLL